MKIGAIADIDKSEKLQSKQFAKEISFSRFTDKNKEDWYREFALLLRAGVDFNGALKILIDQEKSKFLKSIYSEIHKDIIKGKTLYQAVRVHKNFSPYECQSIKIGEDTKSLPVIFDQLHRFYSRKIRMRRQITSVISYPIFVLIITFCVLYFMLNYVVPMFSSVFQQFGKELPAITQTVVRLSDNFWIINSIMLFFFLSLFLINKTFKKNDIYRRLTTSVYVKLPFIGGLIQKIYLARFCQALSLLLSARTPLLTSLTLTQEMITFYPINKAISDVKGEILKGSTLSASLSKHHFFSPKIISLTTIGEQTNELGSMYEGLAKQYDEDIEHTTKLIGSILEPLMIVIIGGVVGFIMLAMYSPIFNLSKILDT